MSLAPAVVEACCANLYGHPLVELIVGESFHPGGLASTRRLLDEARLPVGARLLDAGCGLGASARLAAAEFGLTVDACDVSEPAIQRGKVLADGAGAALHFEIASVMRLPYDDGRFAGVLAECVLSTTSKRRALAELRRVIAADGVLLVTDVTSTGAVDLPGPLGDVLCLTGAFRPGELEDDLERGGFAIVHARDEHASIAALLDRLEVRLGLVTTILRDTASTAGLAQAAWGQVPIAEPGRIVDAFRDARQLFASGAIGYRAVVARAVPVD